MTYRKAALFGVALVAAAALLTVTVGATTVILQAAAADQGSGQRQPPGPPPGGPGGPGGSGGLDQMVFDLDLTAAQLDQVKALREESRAATKKYEQELRDIEDRIRAAVEAETFDEAAVRALVVSEATPQNEIRFLRARLDAAIYALLTAEQRTALKQMHQGPRLPPPGQF